MEKGYVTIRIHGGGRGVCYTRLGLVHGMGKPPNVSVAAVMRTVARDAQPDWRERDLQAAFKMEVGRLNPEIDWCGPGKVRGQEGGRVNSRPRDSLNDRIDLVGYSCTDPPRPLIAFEFKLTSPLGAGKLGKVNRVEFAADIGRLGARSLTRFPAGGDLLHGHCLVTPGLPGPFVPLDRGSPRAISSGYGSGTRASTPLRPSPSLGAGTAVTPVPV